MKPNTNTGSNQPTRVIKKPTTNKVMRIGSRVKHNFSGEVGIVTAWRKDKNGYDYRVEWDNASPDWYQLKVLELL